jgi:DNA repair protein RecN (Recombination protein N)
MLTELHVENMGIITDLRLPLGAGVTALTGETGAGKTMLVEAILLLLGGRADPMLVRPGAAEAWVEGRFVRGDEEVVLARALPADGRSRAYANGRAATAALVAEIGEGLVEVHGQHGHQQLLHAAAQRQALDQFAGIDLSGLSACRQRRSALEAEQVALGGDARSRAREADLLRFQLAELIDANLVDADEDQVLEQAEDVLAGATAFREAAERALAALVDEDGASDRLGAGMASLHGKGPFEAVAQRLRSAQVELDDAAVDLRRVAEGIEEDPARLADVRARRQRLRELCRKYGDTLQAVMIERDELADRLARLDHHEERVAELQRAIDGEMAQETTLAAEVAGKRKAASPRLGQAIQRHLRLLALPKACVEVEVEGSGSADQVTFLLQANPGQTLLPLAKVASGGELARVMLALRLVLLDAPDTLIFDEVDAGIGGEAAFAVGRSLAELGRDRQVFVVTHLAQVAAFADQHIVVTKQQGKDHTVALATAVSGEDRLRELARMLSGLSESASARTHAEELLAAAAAGRAPALANRAR